ncbi:MAG: AsmA-like C-terminal region-containing protein [Candidatus Binatia bacterium]|nr:AsmA-like C-terminal region-containing protein [Candidatus Binatia bacterium]
MARTGDPGLAAIRSMVRDAFLDTSSEFGQDPAIYEEHPNEFQLANYIEHLLSDSEEAAFESHVAMCSDCAEELVLSTRVVDGERRKEASSYWKIAAGVALAMGGLIAALLAGRSAGNYLEGSMLAGLEAGLGGRASVNAVSVSFLGGPQIELDGLIIDDPAGGDPLIAAPSAKFVVDLASVRDGEFGGDLELDRPVINVTRSTSGDVNIDSLLPTSERLSGLLADAAKNSVRSVRVTDGIIRIIDRAAGGPREVRMADVDAVLEGLSETAPATLRARAGIESTEQNLGLVGTVGPWGGGTPPQYRFSEVDLDAVPLRALASARSAIRGGLSYDGTLRTVGNGWDQIASNVSGAGKMQVVSGALVGKNLIADTIRPWIGDGDAPTHLGMVLAAADTPFDEIRTAVSVRRSGLSARDLHAYGQGFEIVGAGSLESTGVVDFTGTLVVSAEMSAELVAIAPVSGKLLNENRQLAIPFQVDGTWPQLQPRVDLEVFASRFFPMPRLATLFFAPRAG